MKHVIMKENVSCSYFTMSELYYSQMAIENGIDNTPTEEAETALYYLRSNLLQPLREEYGNPIHILSGYRCPEVNRLVKGVADSQHLRGEAVDLYIPEGPEFLWRVLVRSGLDFDQAILYRKRNFLHISLKATGINRQQVLWK